MFVARCPECPTTLQYVRTTEEGVELYYCTNCNRFFFKVATYCPVLFHDLTKEVKHEMSTLRRRNGVARRTPKRL